MIIKQSHGMGSISRDLQTCFVIIDISKTVHLAHIVNTLRPRQNGLPFADDILKFILLNYNV